jgi:2-keto-3-deoxy-L-rhamnonate aldolase RhmA
MRHSKVLARIRAGGVARVCSVSAPFAAFPALASQFKYDGVWVDAEHRPWDCREAESMLARHHLADIDCIWRPPTREKGALYRLLEDGATGLMIPHVSTPEQARDLVQAVKFPPIGDRGLDGSGQDANFLLREPVAYASHANRETFLVVQLETPQALDNAAAIAAIPGVDVLFIGPGDLSLRLGCAPAVNDPKMLDAQKTVAAAAARHGKAWGRPVGTAEAARAIIELGAKFVAYGSAHWGIRNHLAECSAHFDEMPGAAGATAS